MLWQAGQQRRKSIAHLAQHEGFGPIKNGVDPVRLDPAQHFLVPVCEVEPRLVGRLRLELLHRVEGFGIELGRDPGCHEGQGLADRRQTVVQERLMRQDHHLGLGIEPGKGVQHHERIGRRKRADVTFGPAVGLAFRAGVIRGRGLHRIPIAQDSARRPDLGQHAVQTIEVLWELVAEDADLVPLARNILAREPQAPLIEWVERVVDEGLGSLDQSMILPVPKGLDAAMHLIDAIDVPRGSGRATSRDTEHKEVEGAVAGGHMGYILPPPGPKRWLSIAAKSINHLSNETTSVV